MAKVADLEVLFAYGLDVAGRKVYVTEDVDHDTMSAALKGFHVLERLSNAPITVVIMTNGGDVETGLALYDAMRASACHVTTQVRGKGYSMGAWLLQGGHHRTINAHGALMIHDGSGLQNAFYRILGRQCVDILWGRIKAKHPKYKRSQLQRLLDTDTYMTAVQALELGLVDEIV